MSKFEQATIAERIDLTDELAIFRIKSSIEFDFTPGQFATLALEESGAVIQRAYSMVSAPHEPLLEFFVELVPDGLLTSRLWDMKAGDALLLRNQPAGAFLLDRKSGKSHHLMLATVTGVAPFLSMIRHHAFNLANGQGEDLRFALIHGASHARELGVYANELADIARQGWLLYVPTVSRPTENPDWTGEVGRADDVVRKHADNQGFTAENSIAYACGHPAMVENARTILQRARFSRMQIRTEKYFTLKLPK